MTSAIQYLYLSQGKYAMVDADDYGWLSKWKWSLTARRSGLCYAYRVVDGHSIQMHRLITDAPPRMEVDHIDHDGLNNSRSNLRVCTHQENIWNNAKRPWGKSGYWGVCFIPRIYKWEAMIGIDYHVIHLGYFDAPEAAALAYDEAARKYHGEYAKQNFPTPSVGDAEAR